MSTQGQTIMYTRGGRRRKGLNVDLNVPPPTDDEEQVGGPFIHLGQGGQGDHPATPTPPVRQGHLPTIPQALGEQGHQLSGSTPTTTIDVEELDDDVVISSREAFEAARNSSRRNPGRTLVVDVESENVTAILGLNQLKQRRRLPSNQTLANFGLYVHLEGCSRSMSTQRAAPPPPPPPPPPPTFTCPVCMGPLVEEMTTKCGHIFCKDCITTAIAAQPKCPTCRRKVTKRDIIRVYLPAAN